MIDTINWVKEVDINLTDEDKQVYVIPNYNTYKNQYLVQAFITHNDTRGKYMGQILTLPNCKETIVLNSVASLFIDNKLGIIFNTKDGPIQNSFFKLNEIKIFSKPFEIIENIKSIFIDNQESRLQAFKDKWEATHKK